MVNTFVTEFIYLFRRLFFKLNFKYIKDYNKLKILRFD